LISTGRIKSGSGAGSRRGLQTPSHIVLSYSRSPEIPALQQLQKSSESASTTPQRPIWNSFSTVVVRDFWENGCRTAQPFNSKSLVHLQESKSIETRFTYSSTIVSGRHVFVARMILAQVTSNSAQAVQNGTSAGGEITLHDAVHDAVQHSFSGGCPTRASAGVRALSAAHPVPRDARSCSTDAVELGEQGGLPVSAPPVGGCTSVGHAWRYADVADSPASPGGEQGRTSPGEPADRTDNRGCRAACVGPTRRYDRRRWRACAWLHWRALSGGSPTVGTPS